MTAGQVEAERVREFSEHIFSSSVGLNLHLDWMKIRIEYIHKFDQIDFPVEIEAWNVSPS